MADQFDLAQRAWRVLAATALERKILTYAELAEQLGSHARAMRLALWPIMDYCLANGLPPLTILVVNAQTRSPGDGFIAWSGPLHEGQEKVWKHAWPHEPPAREALEASMGTGHDLEAEMKAMEEPLISVLTLSVADVHDRIEALLKRRSEFETLTERRPFTVKPKGMDLELRIATGGMRVVKYSELVRVLNRWKTLPAPRVSDFSDLTQNASYICALIEAAIRAS